MDFGLVGEKLSHSFSKEIHDSFKLYDYKFIEVDKDHFDSFILKKNYKGLNVTIPFKETVLKHIDVLSDNVKRIGAVNTIVNRNGKLYGYNTDYIGLKKLIEENKIVIKGKNVLILGTGGTSKTTKAVAEDLGALEIRCVNHKDIESGKVYDYKDFADVIINTTPVGMYPNVDCTPIDIMGFENACNSKDIKRYKISSIIDIIYNPKETRLIREAKAQEIKAVNGLSMLYYQAEASMVYFKEVM